MSAGLFDWADDPRFAPQRPVKIGRAPGELSPDRARTERNARLLASGVHPVTRVSLRPQGETCGDCVHHLVNRRSKTYHKCELNATRGAGTDIRVSWPACILFKPAEGTS